MASQAATMRVQAPASGVLARTAPAIRPSSLTGMSTVKSPARPPSVTRLPDVAARTPLSAMAGPVPITRAPLMS